MRTQSLHFKLICIYGMAVALVLVFAGGIIYQIFKYRAYAIFDSGLTDLSRQFIAQVRFENDHFVLSTQGLSVRMSSVTVADIEPYAIVTDESGKIIYRNTYDPYIQSMIQGGQLDRVLAQRSGIGLAVADDGTVFRFVNLEIPSGTDSVQRVVHIGRSTGRLASLLDTYAQFCMWSVPFMLLISVATGWFITNRALMPFRDFAKAAEQISSENLNTRIVSKYREAEVQTLVKSFNAMVNRLNRSFQQMRSFNADAAHELRTPLSIMRADTELLLQSANVSDREIRAALESNLEELDRLTYIINDMLMLSEAEAGDQVILKESIHFEKLVEGLLEQLRTFAAARDVQIKLLDMPEVRIEGDESLIRRAILNVLDNAIKYSKDSGTVEVSAGVESAKVLLAIKDYGIGIEPADLPYIFDRLFRADRARNRERGGIGLGLSITKWIIEAHQGSIQVTSTYGQGTTFVIALPIHPDQ
jgi:heavy metal sensor kinase